MAALRVTDHAVKRYEQRVLGRDIECVWKSSGLDRVLALRAEIRAFVSERTQRAIDRFGKCQVRIPSGHRLVVRDGTVITVNPKRE